METFRASPNARCAAFALGLSDVMKIRLGKRAALAKMLAAVGITSNDELFPCVTFHGDPLPCAGASWAGFKMDFVSLDVGELDRSIL